MVLGVETGVGVNDLAENIEVSPQKEQDNANNRCCNSGSGPHSIDMTRFVVEME